MLTLSNLLSLLRAPLALLFLKEDVSLRCVAIALAMVTDVLDGYLARRCGCVSRLGAVLDPFMDRFFVLFCFSVLLVERALGSAEVVAMLTRDFAIAAFILYSLFTTGVQHLQIGSLWCGKATTILQFLVLMSIVLKMPMAHELMTAFVLLGLCSFVELVLQYRATAKIS